ncbi:hypothetical protein ECG_02458 [Echinococcus granulosus]|uniref:Uncharacterized protein n=1 Tax=Echinococcus granulosus TaxID=6210 RepID=W6UK09_ECHGR|nr:hypothetical protein EGR_03751 [Echinococcus granulosus]EUB61461.1 hypothetical protein EGR_03751 [Echinococcus granulosus]KAH9284035.1 hypothetical protein ECG_02458 [Echinococcus granulosus]
MSNTKSCNGRNGSVDHDEEFVVPHMEIACTLNSVAYMRVLEHPWIYLHNWENLNVGVQNAATQAFFNEAQDIKNYLNSSEAACVMPAESIGVGSSPESCDSALASTESDQQHPQQ